jgi:ABC-2 type transport system permease protein
MLGQTTVYVATSMITGIAFGAMLLSSAPAIVLYFALPLAWTALGSLAFLESAARWLDGARSLAPMTDELMSTTQWARAGTTLAVWMLLPLLVGLWRVTRGDVR